MSALISDTRRDLNRWRHKLMRKGPPTIHYFHQVDDPHSHLAIQKIPAIAANYDVRFEFHLCSRPSKDDQGDSSRFETWILNDARNIAEHFNVTLPNAVERIEAGQRKKAEEMLSEFLNQQTFPEAALEVGTKLWTGKNLKSARKAKNIIDSGNKLRKNLGHWLSGTFYFEGEWYWGIDRLHHLERRLIESDISSNNSSPIVKRPEENFNERLNASFLSLEFFPSLRSPYSAICFDRVISLADKAQINLVLKPVMPMMMRGVSASRNKQIYIMTDAKREADYYEQKLGPIVDPIGSPVKKAFELLPNLKEMDKDIEFCGNYLTAAWKEGVDITSQTGLKKVLERSGVTWEEVNQDQESLDWKILSDKNLNRMMDIGFWGVPTFNLTGGGMEDLSCWGQDRLWLIKREIEKRVAHFNKSSANG